MLTKVKYVILGHFYKWYFGSNDWDAMVTEYILLDKDLTDIDKELARDFCARWGIISQECSQKIFDVIFYGKTIDN